jgi:hypothetical protein
MTEACRLLGGNQPTDFSERAFRRGRLPQQSERLGEIAKCTGRHKFARDERNGKHAAQEKCRLIRSATSMAVGPLRSRISVTMMSGTRPSSARIASNPIIDSHHRLGGIHQ